MGSKSFTRIGVRVSRLCSATAGPCRQTIGTRRCCSSSITIFRVVAHDRRGHGRSSQTADGHDMDHYADDLAAVTTHLDLRETIHVGHSTGGGEVVHYLARHGESRTAKAALLCAVPPLMVKTAANQNGFPRKSLTDFKRSSRSIAHNSIATSLLAPSTATTVRTPSRPRP